MDEMIKKANANKVVQVKNNVLSFKAMMDMFPDFTPWPEHITSVQLQKVQYKNDVMYFSFLSGDTSYVYTYKAPTEHSEINVRVKASYYNFLSLNKQLFTYAELQVINAAEPTWTDWVDLYTERIGTIIKVHTKESIKAGELKYYPNFGTVKKEIMLDETLEDVLV